MKPQTLSFVLPITLQEDVQALDWRSAARPVARPGFQLLLRSFLRSFELDGLEVFLIVCPGPEKGAVQEMLGEITEDPRFRVMGGSFMPKVFALRYGADFPWLKENKDVSSHACPDANNPVVFEIRRIRD